MKSEEVGEIWRGLVEQGLTLHAGLLLYHGRAVLAVAPYWDCLQMPNAQARKSLQPRLNHPLVSQLLRMISQGREIFPMGQTALLPAVTDAIPLPAPFSLGRASGGLAARRLSMVVRRGPKPGRFSLHAAGFSLEHILDIAAALLSLEDSFPGGLTPSSLELLQCISALEKEISDVALRGEWLGLGEWEKTVLTGQRFFDSMPPGLDEWLEAIEKNWCSATKLDAELVANLSFDRCWHWMCLLSSCNAKCLFDGHLRHVGQGFSLVLAQLVALGSKRWVSRGPGPTRDSLLEARKNPSGFWAFLSLLRESRPFSPHVALVVDKSCESSERLRIRPAAFRPSWHLLTPAKRRRLSDSGDVLPLDVLMKSGEGNPIDWVEGVATCPGSRYWLVLDILRLMRRYPKWFLNPTLLQQGAVVLDDAEMEAMRDSLARDHGRDLKPGSVSCVPFGDLWREAQGVEGLRPILVSPKMGGMKSRQWWDREGMGANACCNVLSWEWLDWVERPSVRLGVTWELSADMAGSGPLAAVLEILRSGRKVPWDLLPTMDLGDAVRFSPRPWFEVNGTEILYSAWVKAKKKSGGYLLPTGVLVPAEAYESLSERFLTRQKAYNRMGSVPVSQVWRSHMAATQEESGCDPSEYLRHLEMRLTPQMREIYAAIESAALEKVAGLGPLGSSAVLRPYQQAGVAMLLARARMGLHVCLADEMGLGKTIQTIAFILAVFSENSGARVLVVVPKSLIRNWQKEWARFAPAVTVGEWQGEAPFARVTLITYARVRLDVEKLAAYTFDAVILDEAHTIKNAETQVAQAVRRLNARTRLALSGTPIENRASELWNVMDWLNPGYLGRRQDFEKYVGVARGYSDKMLMLRPLHAALAPVLLRRMKSDEAVALSLPDKIVEEHNYELSAEQEALYHGVVEVTLGDPKVVGSGPKARALYLKALMHLKQICDHPALFVQGETSDWLDELASSSEEFSGVSLRRLASVVERVQKRRDSASSVLDRHRERSGKLAAFVELMERLREGAAGVVVFTQFVDMGTLLCDVLAQVDDAWWGSVPFLHGQLTSEERMDLVDSFQEACRLHAESKRGAPPVLVASLKAGGLGLNLTGADHVVHYDRWWNPAVEDQASDRLHRFGQKRTVTVHLFTAERTLEESVARLLEEKRALAKDLLGLGAAAAEGLGEATGNRDSFLNLVDPSRRFER